MFITKRSALKPITGSIQPKDGKWYAVINLYKDGKRKPKWICTGFHTRNGKKRATLFLYEELARLNSSRIISPENLDAFIPFMTFLYSWLDTKKIQVSPATYRSYESLIVTRIKNYFEPLDKSLSMLLSSDFEKFYSYLYSHGLSECSALHYHRMLKQALSYAVRQGILPHNAMNNVKAPSDTSFIGSYYSNDEVKTLLEAAESSDIFIPVLLTAYYGFRRSEVIGLQWNDIDFNRKLIHINRKVLEEYENGRKSIVSYDKLKSLSSRRTLPLIPIVERELLKEMKRQAEATKADNPPNHVCLGVDGNLISPNYVSCRFRALLETHDMRRIRFHDLRHTCASLLALNGVPIKNIQVWLGHSDFRITARYYAHLDFSAQEQSAAVISQAIQF
ncbi:MAG: tyrosine-type recombinase/integrase [Christensenellales bacterium]